MNGSWRTTSVGYAQFAVVLLTAVISLLSGQQLTPDQAGEIADAGGRVGAAVSPDAVIAFGLIAYGALQAVGMKAARDNKVTSEEAGAKR